MDDSPDVRVAAATIRPEGGSWPGVRDSFGERATAVDADGRSVDLLRLFAAFTPASRALADRIARLGVDRPAVGRAIALERDEPSSRLIVISEHVPGVRLSELLQTAAERSVVADLGAALFVMRRLLTLAESLTAATRIAQFSIAPERIVITPHGRVVIVEPVLAAAAETAAIRLNDIAGIAIAGMSIMLGHLIEDAEHIDPLSAVVHDAADVAAIRAGNRFSTALRLWIDRALIADPTLSFPDFRQARLALSRVGLARESGCDSSRRALKVFLNDLAIERLTDVEAAALEVGRLREMRATRRARWKAISAPDEVWISVEDELLIGHESRVVLETIQGAVVELPGERSGEAIVIGPRADPGMAAPVEEMLAATLVEELLETGLVEEPIEAGLVEEPIEAALVEEPIEPAPAPSPRSWLRSMIRQLGPASAEPQPLQTELPAPPIEGLLPEEAEPVAVDMLDQSPAMEPAIETQAERPAEAAQDLTAFSAEEDEPPPIDTDAAEEPETLEHPAANRPETVAAEFWSASADPLLEETITPRVDGGEERPADAVEETPTRAVEAELPVEDLEEWLAEEAEALPADAPIDAEADAEPDILERPAASLPEPVAAESSRSWAAPAWEESFTARGEGDERLAEASEAEPIEIAEAELPVETIDAPLQQEEPVASVDESLAAELSEDAHKSWIRSITEQLGRMRRREKHLPEPPAATTVTSTDATPLVDHTETESPGELREPVEEIETLFADDAEETPAVEAAPVQLERAAIFLLEERTEQPAAWATPAPAPWRDADSAARRALPSPAEPVDREYAPHHGVLHEQLAGAHPHRPDAQPAREAPGPRTIVVPPRKWTRAAATILIAGLALAMVAALVIAGRSYYRSMSTPGTIAVDSTPRGSEVLVGGTVRGVTPLTLTLKPGDYVLEFRRNGLARQFPIAVTSGAQLSQQLDWSTVRATGTLAISSTPSQARVTVDGKERGVTPLTVSDVPVGMRRVVIESSAGTVRRNVRVVANSQVTINETIISGWIAAFAPFELQIYEGTRLLGTTDGRIMVRPGRHELDFVNTRLGFRERRGIDVNPGMTTAVNIATVVGIVRITAPAGADVLIDGVLFGDTPLRELRLPIGTHEIVLRHPQLGEQRVSVTVGASAPTEVIVDFRKR